VTYSYPQQPGDPPGTIVVWDVDRSVATQSQVPLRSWPTEPFGKNNFFKWSHDDKFLAVGRSKYLRNPQAEQVRGGLDYPTPTHLHPVPCLPTLSHVLSAKAGTTGHTNCLMLCVHLCVCAWRTS
jgi:hypothetical protein